MIKVTCFTDSDLNSKNKFIYTYTEHEIKCAVIYLGPSVESSGVRSMEPRSVWHLQGPSQFKMRTDSDS